MPKETIPFEEFLIAAGAQHQKSINQLHEFLQENGCIVKIKMAANGHVVSYVHKPTSRTVANYLFRKGMPMLRIYADNTANYLDMLAKWPDDMKNTIKKGGNCSRLANPTACNSRCLQGFDFVLDGEHQQKCRCHMAFTFFLDDETNPHLMEIMKHEMEART